MRNDLNDEPVNVPSLTIDNKDPLEAIEYAGQNQMRNGKHSRFSNKTVAYMLLFLFVVYSAGMVVLFWVFKQAADDVRYQLDEKTHSTSMVSENNSGKLQAISEQVNNQQQATKTNLESMRAQNKQLANQLSKILEAQQAITAKQVDQAKRLAKLEEQLTTLSKAGNQDQVKQLATEVAALKKSQETVNGLTADIQTLKKQNLPQAVKSVQDDLLLLRSQLDNTASTSDNASQAKLEKQLQDVQTQLQNLQQQLNNRSPY